MKRSAASGGDHGRDAEVDEQLANLPDHLRRKRFGIVSRGFDQDEVLQLLNEVSLVVERLQGGEDRAAARRILADVEREQATLADTRAATEAANDAAEAACAAAQDAVAEAEAARTDALATFAQVEALHAEAVAELERAHQVADRARHYALAAYAELDELVADAQRVIEIARQTPAADPHQGPSGWTATASGY